MKGMCLQKNAVGIAKGILVQGEMVQEEKRFLEISDWNPNLIVVNFTFSAD